MNLLEHSEDCAPLIPCAACEIVSWLRTRLPPEDFAELVTNLFVPIANDPASRVKVVFSASTTQRDAYSLQQIPNLLNYTVEANIDADDLARYAGEMVLFEHSERIRKMTREGLDLEDNPRERGMARLASIVRYLGERYLDRIGRIQ